MHRSDLYWSELLNVAVLAVDNDADLECESAQSLTHRKESTTSSDTSNVLRVIPINCEASTCNEVLVYRRTLVNLEVQHIQKCAELKLRDEETIAFMGAIMMFPEWDNFDRPSYVWPDLIIDLIKSPLEWKSWRKCVDRYYNARPRSSKNKLCRLLHNSRERLYLFFLCLAHCGFDVDEDLGSLLFKLGPVMDCNNADIAINSSSEIMSPPPTVHSHQKNIDSASPNVMKPFSSRHEYSPLSQTSGGIKRCKSVKPCSFLSLRPPLASVSSTESYSKRHCCFSNSSGDFTLPLTVSEVSVLELIKCIRSFQNINQVMDEQNVDKSFQRQCTRVGRNYQALELPTVQQRSCSTLEAGAFPRSKVFRVFKPGVLTDTEIDSYLQEVKDNVSVEVGDLVEAWKPSQSNVVALGSQSSLASSPLGLSLDGDSKSGKRLDPPFQDASEMSSAVLSWRAWNDFSRQRRLRMHQQYLQYAKSIRFGASCTANPSTIPKIKAPIGVVVACDDHTKDGQDMSNERDNINNNDTKNVYIFDGEVHFSVDAKDVRSVTYSEDTALDILHASNYNVGMALVAVRKKCDMGCFRETIHWDVQDVNVFMDFIFSQRTSSSYLNIYDTFCKVRESRLSWALANEIENNFSPSRLSNNARVLDMKRGLKLSMKDAIYFYIIFLAVNGRFVDEVENTVKSLVPSPLDSHDLMGRNVGTALDKDKVDFAKQITSTSRAHRIDTKSKVSVGGVPNRWPKHLPFAAHNIYYIVNSNTPCICLGLEISNKEPSKCEVKSHPDGILMRVLPVSSTSYQYPQKLSPAALRALTEENLHKLNDDRSREFILAMKDFAEEELRGSPNCAWYTYPNFLLNLISKPYRWKVWRKQVEKAAAAAGKCATRRDIYFAAMKNEEEIKAEERHIHTELPWDDCVYETEVPAMSPVSRVELHFHKNVACTGKRKRSASADDEKTVRQKPVKHSDKNVTHGDIKSNTKSALPSNLSKVLAQDTNAGTVDLKPIPDEKKKLPYVCPLKTNINMTTSINKEKKTKGKAHPDSPQLPQAINMANIWWLPKYSLPCIFYGYPGDEYKDSFVVRPICCSSFHYELKVSVSDLEKLTDERLKHCNDDRTRDFASALLGFLDWETRRTRYHQRTSKNVNGASEGSVGNEQQPSNKDPPTGKTTAIRARGIGSLSVPFVWPDFIYDLIVYRDKWSIWKKSVERSMRGGNKSGARRQAYLSALIQDHLELEKKEIGHDNVITLQDRKDEKDEQYFEGHDSESVENSVATPKMSPTGMKESTCCEKIAAGCLQGAHSSESERDHDNRDENIDKENVDNIGFEDSLGEIEQGDDYVNECCQEIAELERKLDCKYRDSSSDTASASIESSVGEGDHRIVLAESTRDNDQGSDDGHEKSEEGSEVTSDSEVFQRSIEPRDTISIGNGPTKRYKEEASDSEDEEENFENMDSEGSIVEGGKGTVVDCPSSENYSETSDDNGDSTLPVVGKSASTAIILSSSDEDELDESQAHVQQTKCEAF